MIVELNNKLGKMGFTFLSAIMFALAGCGGGSGDSSNIDPGVLSGVFIDSPVTGLTYTTDTLIGLTDAQGQFEYREDENVSFKLGGISLGEAKGGSTVTPSDLTYAGLSASTPLFNNMLRFLQTLDEDCNPDNGIVINAAMQSVADNMSLDLPTTTFEFEQHPDLLTLLGLSSCATQWVSRLQAESHYRLSMQAEAADDLKRIAVLTPEGETEPKVIIDDEGNTVTLLPGKPEYNESAVIVLQSSAGRTTSISVGTDGLPKNVFFDDGSIMVLSNHTGESVDILISFLNELDISARVKLTDLAKLNFSLLALNQNVSIANQYQYKNTNYASSTLVDFFIRPASAAGDVTQVLSNGMKNASSIMKYIEEVGKVVSVTYSGASKLKYGSDIINSVLLNVSLNILTLNKDQARVAKMSMSALTCAGALNVAGCGSLMFDSAASIFELGGLIVDWYNDRDRINALEEKLKTLDFESMPPVVKLAASMDGKEYFVADTITLTGGALDPNEGIISDDRLTWTSSRDGALGQGSSLGVKLSPGVHIITLTAQALDGETRSRGFSLEVINGAPVVSITLENGDTFMVGDTVVLTGSVNDPEDGVLNGASLVWTSSVDPGELGSGTSLFTSNLSADVHTITLTATDAYGKTGSDSVKIKIKNDQYIYSVTGTLVSSNYDPNIYNASVGVTMRCGMPGVLGDKITYSESWKIDGQDCSANGKCLLKITGDWYSASGDFFNPETFAVDYEKNSPPIKTGSFETESNGIMSSYSQESVKFSGQLDKDTSVVTGTLTLVETITWTVDNSAIVCRERYSINATP